MIHSTDLKRYLDRNMQEEEEASFSSHLADCNDCRDELERWKSVEGRIVSWAREVVPEQDAERAARALVNRAKEGKTPRRVVLPWALGLAGAAALAAVVITRAPGLSTPSEEPVQVSVLDGAPSGGAASELAAPADHRLLLGIERDRVGVAAQSKLVVAAATSQRTELLLQSGRAAFSVFPRKGKRQPFVIDAGAYRVSVVGTRFLVNLAPAPGVALEVSVQEGTVRVAGAGKTSSVTIGQRLQVRDDGAVQELAMDAAQELLIASLLREPGTPEPQAPQAALAPTPAESPTPTPAEIAAEEPEEARPAVTNRASKTRTSRTASAAGEAQLERWRQLVLKGEYKAAETELVAHLTKSPKDPDAWLLLGDARRKAGRNEAAVQAYRRVAGLADAAAANQARFLAAVLLQDQLDKPREALELLRAYLAQGQGYRPLEAAALVRSAKAHLSLGQRDEGRRVLQSVLIKHADSPSAKEAQKLLAE